MTSAKSPFPNVTFWGSRWTWVLGECCTTHRSLTAGPPQIMSIIHAKYIYPNPKSPQILIQSSFSSKFKISPKKQQISSSKPPKSGMTENLLLIRPERTSSMSPVKLEKKLSASLIQWWNRDKVDNAYSKREKMEPLKELLVQNSAEQIVLGFKAWKQCVT